MHKNAFDGRFLPGSIGGAYSAPPDPTAGLWEEGIGKGEERERGREEGGGRREGGGPKCLKCVDANAIIGQKRSIFSVSAKTQS